MPRIIDYPKYEDHVDKTMTWDKNNKDLLPPGRIKLLQNGRFIFDMDEGTFTVSLQYFIEKILGLVNKDKTIITDITFKDNALQIHRDKINVDGNSSNHSSIETLSIDNGDEITGASISFNPGINHQLVIYTKKHSNGIKTNLKMPNVSALIKNQLNYNDGRPFITDVKSATINIDACQITFRTTEGNAFTYPLTIIGWIDRSEIESIVQMTITRMGIQSQPQIYSIDNQTIEGLL